MNKTNKNYSIGVDIGGTKMGAVLFDGERVLADYVLATPTDSLEHFMIMLKALIEPLQERARKEKMIIKGIGVGIPGMLDYKENKIVNCPNLPLLNGLKLPLDMESKLGLAIKMDHDSNCFLRAEMKLGAGKKARNVYGIQVGTGISSAWWVNGQAYLGAHGGAGEMAWSIIDFKEGIALEEAYHKLTQNSPATLAEEAFRGDILAEKSYEEFGHYLGICLANMVNIIDPELIIIGGGVIESSDLFLSRTKKIMRRYIKSPEAKVTKIVKGKLGSQAGAIGAAMLVS